MKVLRKGIIAKGGYTFGQGNYWPSVARLPDGRLAAVWSGGRHAHVCPYGKVLISYSNDEGVTWTEPSWLSTIRQELAGKALEYARNIKQSDGTAHPGRNSERTEKCRYRIFAAVRRRGG